VAERIFELFIDGMSCPACELRVGEALRGVAGVTEARVDYAKGTALVAGDGAVVTPDALRAAVAQAGYAVKTPDAAPKKRVRTLIGSVLGVFLVLFAVYFLLNRTGLVNVLNGFPTPGNSTSLAMLLVIGLLTSIHCVAMCGGINVSANVQRPPAETEKPAALPVAGDAATEERAATLDASPAATTAPRRRPAIPLRRALLYNLGRVAGYTAIGALVGLLGRVLTLTETGRGVVTILAGVLMLLMGLNMLGLLPFLRYITPRLPKGLTRRLSSAKARAASPLAVGLLNALMPCGPLQAMQIYALSTGSPLYGALSMLLFALGTVPLMFAVGALSSLLTARFAKKVMAVAAAVIMVMGLVMLGNGVSLTGTPLPAFLGGTGPLVEATLSESGDVQTVAFDLQSRSYAAIKVKHGVPVVWTIRATVDTLSGCNETLSVKKFDITRQLVAGDNVIEFTPDTPGTYGYSCWMGMIKSTIVVY
jgi:sulfite exporter TauE/SafE/copper chaperone CopZ